MRRPARASFGTLALLALACGLVAPQAVVSQGRKASGQQIVVPPRAVPATRAAAMPKAVPLAPPRPDRMAEAFEKQFQSALRAELHVAQSVCGLDKAQRESLPRVADEAVHAAAKKLTDMYLSLRRGRAAPMAVDRRDFLQDAMAAALKAHLSPEQSARYEAEVKDRIASEKDAAVRNLVANVDTELTLTPTQRGELRLRLLARWNDAWRQSLQQMVPGRAPFAMIPDDCVMPSLTPAQRFLWRELKYPRAVTVWDVQVPVTEIDNALLLEDPGDGDGELDGPIPQPVRRKAARRGRAPFVGKAP